MTVTLFYELITEVVLLTCYLRGCKSRSYKYKKIIITNIIHFCLQDRHHIQHNSHIHNNSLATLSSTPTHPQHRTLSSLNGDDSLVCNLKTVSSDLCNHGYFVNSYTPGHKRCYITMVTEICHHCDFVNSYTLGFNGCFVTMVMEIYVTMVILLVFIHPNTRLSCRHCDRDLCTMVIKLIVIHMEFKDAM